MFRHTKDFAKPYQIERVRTICDLADKKRHQLQIGTNTQKDQNASFSICFYLVIAYAVSKLHRHLHLIRVLRKDRSQDSLSLC